MVLDWLAARDADYASLNELNGLNASTFSGLGAARGFGHAAFLEAATGYHLGFLSRRDPIVSVERHTRGFRHGALRVSMGTGLHFIITHLTPGTPTERSVSTIQLNFVR